MCVCVRAECILPKAVNPSYKVLKNCKKNK